MQAAQVEIEKTAQDTAQEIGRAVAATRQPARSFFESVHFAEWYGPALLMLVYLLARRLTVSIVRLNEEKLRAEEKARRSSDVLLCDKMVSPKERERIKREWDEAKKIGGTIVLPAGIRPGETIRVHAKGDLDRLIVDEVSCVPPALPGSESLIVTRTSPEGVRVKIGINCDSSEATSKLEEIRKILKRYPEPPPGPKPFFPVTREPLDDYGPGILEQLYPAFLRANPITSEEVRRRLGIKPGFGEMKWDPDVKKFVTRWDDDKIEPDEQDRTIGLGGTK